MNRKTRDRHLTPEEADKYNTIRKQARHDYPGRYHESRNIFQRIQELYDAGISHKDMYDYLIDTGELPEDYRAAVEPPKPLGQPIKLATQDYEI